jgi:uncharacterized membrane protein
LAAFVFILMQRLKVAEARINDLSDTVNILLARLPKARATKTAAQDKAAAQDDAQLQDLAKYPLQDNAESPKRAAIAALKQSDPNQTVTRTSATIVGSGRTKTQPEASVTTDEAEEVSRSTSWQVNFEDLVGGKLPIWVGGIALIFAAFFLVRYSIEAGLLGPAARSIIAAVFGSSLIAMSEFGGKLPKIGASFSADRRIGQSLAGAGVAILYGTLYMASEIYGLIGVGTAFALVLAVTAAAFALSLRQGPPTALMGIAGGFAAPWVAGMGAQNMPSLLLYLAVFIAAVFGLAVWRRWLWLLLLASGGGLIWTMYLLIVAEVDLPLLGLFIMVAAIGALVAFERFKEGDGPWAEAARYAPMAVALLQLLLLLPKTDFSLSGWLFFGGLCALTVALGLRDRKMLPLTGGAFALALTAIGSAWLSLDYGSDFAAVQDFKLTIAVSAVAFILFGGPALLHRPENRQDNVLWSLLTATASVSLWTMAAMSADQHLPELGWAAAALVMALPSAWLAWQYRGEGMQPAWIALFANSAAVCFLFTVAMVIALPDDWAPTGFAFGALAVAQVEGKAVPRVILAPMILAILASLILNWRLLEMLLTSLGGEKAFFDEAPTMTETAIKTLIPALMILSVTWRPYFATGARTRIAAQIAGGIGVTAMVYLLLKQPLAIDSDQRFISFGFGERMAITHLLALSGWLAVRYGKLVPQWPTIKPLGFVLGGLALARFVYFDLALLNPAMIVQSFGAIPIINLGTLHCALVAIWMWAYGREVERQAMQQPLFIGGLIAMILTVLVTVRQWSMGSIISGAQMGSGENYLYSAGLMTLAILWLVLGMTGKALQYDKLLRIAGLLLITLVTFKVFLIDAAALTGILRILSFLGLGIALIAIGWGYGKVMGKGGMREQEA